MKLQIEEDAVAALRHLAHERRPLGREELFADFVAADCPAQCFRQSERFGARLNIKCD